MKKLPGQLRRLRHLFSTSPAPRSKRRRMLTSELLESRELLAADVMGGANLLHNQASPTDVNADGRLTAMDALLVINQLVRQAQERTQAAPLVGSESGRTLSAASAPSLSAPSTDTTSPPKYFDVNNDSRVTASDALTVIQHMIEAIDANDELAFTYEITTLDGQPIDPATEGVTVGESFLLNAYVDDLRPEGQGIFSAYLDITFDNALVTGFQNTLTFGPEFSPRGTLGEGNIVGNKLNDAGTAVNGITGVGPDAIKFFSIQFDAIDAGSTGAVTFTGSASGNDLQETTFFGTGGDVEVLDPDFIDFGSLTVLVRGAVDNEIEVAEGDGATVVDVLANDTLSGELTVTAVGAAQKGTVTLDQNGVVRYNPNGQFNALAPGEEDTDTFTYTIENADGTTDTATVTVTITGENQEPVVTGDSFQIVEHAPFDTVVGAVTAADVDSPNDAIEYAIIDGNVNNVFKIDSQTGVITVDNYLALDYEAQPQYQLVVQATDNGGASGTGTVTIDVQDLQLAEIFVEAYDSNGQLLDGGTIAQGETVELRVYVQDNRPQPSGVYYTYLDLEYTASRLSLANPSNPITFGPNFAETGETPTGSALADIYDVDGLLDEIGAADDSLAASPSDQGKVLLFSVDFTADALGQVDFISSPADGELPDVGVALFDAPTLTDAVDVIYGSTTFNVVSVFGAVDDPYTTDEDTVLTVTAPGVLSNDSAGPGGGEKTVQDPGTFTTSAGATVTLAADGSFTYDPTGAAVLQALAPDGEFSDSFQYTLTNGTETETATVTIEVAGVNDVPVVGTIENQVAVEGSPFFLALDSPGIFIDPDAAWFTPGATLEGGAALPAWLTFDNLAFSGTPDDGDVGTLTIEVIATDAFGASDSTTFTLEVQNVEEPPVFSENEYSFNVRAESGAGAVVGSVSASDPDAGAAIAYEISAGNESGIFAIDSTTGQITVAEDGQLAEGTGPFTLTVRVPDSDDPQLEGTATVTINVVPNLDPVVASPIDDQSATEDELYSFTVPVGTFTDPDGDTLTYSAVRVNGHPLRWLTFDASTRTFTGTPRDKHVGEIHIRVTAEDGRGGTVFEDFTVTVANSNDAPQVENPIVNQTVNEDTTLTIDLSGRFTDADLDSGDVLTIQPVADTLPGWLTFDADNLTLSGTPRNGHVGVYTVSVIASDGDASVTDTFQITVVNVNDAPVVTTDNNIQTTKSQVITGTLASYASDADVVHGDSLEVSSATSFTTAKGATVTIGADGSFTYDPRTSTEAAALAFGEMLTDSFEFTVEDEQGATATGTVNVTVNGLDPSSVSGFVYVDANADGRIQSGELRLEGVAVTLAGPNGTVQTVTNAKGLYAFNNLEPGTYTLIQQQPAGLLNAGVTLGTAGGVVTGGNSMTFMIATNQSTDATGYNFREAGIQPSPYAALDLLFFLSDAPQAGVFVAANPTTGQGAVTAQLGGWENYTSIDVDLSSDLSRATITAQDAQGNVYTGTVRTNNPYLFQWVNYRERQFVLTGTPSELGLTLQAGGNQTAQGAATLDSSSTTTTQTTGSTTSAPADEESSDDEYLESVDQFFFLSGF